MKPTIERIFLLRTKTTNGAWRWSKMFCWWPACTPRKSLSVGDRTGAVSKFSRTTCHDETAGKNRDRFRGRLCGRLCFEIWNFRARSLGQVPASRAARRRHDEQPIYETVARDLL